MQPAPSTSLTTAPRARGTGMLLLATILWGSGFLAAKSSLSTWSPALLMLLRFSIAALCFVPFIFGRKKAVAFAPQAEPRPWRDAIILGLVLWLGYILQTIGLQYTTIGRSAFITAMNVVFTPIFAFILGARIRIIIWPCAALALAGTGLLTHDGGSPNAGDWWTLSCAMAWGAYIAHLETVSPRHPPIALAGRQIVVVAVLSLGFWAVDASFLHLSHAVASPAVAANAPTLTDASNLASTSASTSIVVSAPFLSDTAWAWIGLFYLACIVTALTTWLQTFGQQYIPGADASVIYTLEPVFGAGIAWMVAGQTLGPKGLMGAGLIVAAAILISRFPPPGVPAAHAG